MKRCRGALACLQTTVNEVARERVPYECTSLSLVGFAGRCSVDRWDSLPVEPCAVCVPAKALASRGPSRLPAYAALVRECVRCDAQQRCAREAKDTLPET